MTVQRNAEAIQATAQQLGRRIYGTNQAATELPLAQRYFLF